MKKYLLGSDEDGSERVYYGWKWMMIHSGVAMEGILLIHSSYLNDNLVKHVNPIIKVQSLIRFAHEHSVSRI